MGKESFNSATKLQDAHGIVPAPGVLKVSIEPATREVLKMLINARHSLGLTTRLNTSKLGDHSFLSENTVDRVRKLAGSFIEGLQSKLGVKISKLPLHITSLSRVRVTKDF